MAARKGQEFAEKAEVALRDGKLEDCRAFHKLASNAFKEARDSLPEGDTNTKMALNILIDYHRDREKNPGFPTRKSIQQQPHTPPALPINSTSSSTNSLPEAWGLVQEFGEYIQTTSATPPLIETTSNPSFTTTKNLIGSSPDFKRSTSHNNNIVNQQSVMMGESYFIVPGESFPSLGNSSLPQPTGTTKSSTTTSPDKLQATIRSLIGEVERLSKESQLLRSALTREREESRIQKEKFWKMFIVVKQVLEEAKSQNLTGTHSESEVKALTRLLHAESEAKKKLKQI